MPRSDDSVKILAWDTSGRKGYLSALEIFSQAESQESHFVRFSSVLDVDQQQHSEGLLLGVSEALSATGWKLSDLSAFGVGVGPGSFTGVRIGLTTARTLGQMTGLPIVGVSSLEMLEQAVRQSQPLEQQPLLICIEACMGEVYCRWGSTRGSESSEQVLKLVQLEEYLEKYQTPDAGLVLAVLPDRWLDQPVLARVFSRSPWQVIPLSSLSSHAEGLARLVARQWKVGGVVSALNAHPVYLRVSDAELNLKARENALRNRPSGG